MPYFRNTCFLFNCRIVDRVVTAVTESAYSKGGYPVVVTFERICNDLLSCKWRSDCRKTRPHFLYTIDRNSATNKSGADFVSRQRCEFMNRVGANRAVVFVNQRPRSCSTNRSTIRMFFI